MSWRIPKLNSLLRDVISDVIRLRVRNPEIPELLTITKVEITKDLRQATVHVSIIGSPEEQQGAIHALEGAKGFIGKETAQRVEIRYFPKLRFVLDQAAEQHERIEELLQEIEEKREGTPPSSPPSDS